MTEMSSAGFEIPDTVTIIQLYISSHKKEWPSNGNHCSLGVNKISEAKKAKSQFKNVPSQRAAAMSDL